MNSLKFLNEKIILFLVIIAHILFINNYPVSAEYSFIDFAKYFEEYDKSLLNNFINIQANTIIFSFLIYLFKNIFFIENYQIAGRLISVISYFFLYFGVINFSNFFKKSFKLILLLLFLNPIMWIYGFKTTSDLLPTSIGFFAISLLLIKNNNIQITILSSFLTSLAAVLKPMFLILIFFGCCTLFIMNKKRIFKNNIFYIFLYASFPILIFFSYSFWAYFNLGFILSPHVNVNDKQFDYNPFHVISIFFYYFGLLSLFLIPVIIIYFKDFLRIKKLSIIFLLFIFFYLGYSNNFFPGELDLGRFFNFDKNILKGLYFISAFLLFYFFFINFKNIANSFKKIYIIYLLTTFLYIFILSFFRPAQRYLMLLIPISYVLFFFTKKSINLGIVYLSATLCLFICLTLTTHSYLRSQLAGQVMSFLTKKSIILNTDPGPIVDSYNFHRYSQVKKTFKIITVKPDRYLKDFTSKLLLFKISYYLIKI